MPFFLVQAKYSPYTWVYRTTKDPRDYTRPPDLLGLLQAAGVKIHGGWYSFGEYDTTLIVEVDKNEDMATALIGFRAGWDGKAVEDVKATLLLTNPEADRATVNAAKGLAQSRDASKEGPLTETADWTKPQDYRKESGTPESKKSYSK